MAEAPAPGAAAPRGPVVFTRAGIWRGVRTALPLWIGLLPFGLVVGVLSAGKGLTLAETALMSMIVYAGASQLLALELWADPAPILAVTLAAAVVNIRLAPMGAALAPWLDKLRGLRLWGTLATLVDHSFALGVAEQRAGGRDAGYLLGIGLSLWFAWQMATIGGHVLGNSVALPPGHPLFFGGIAAFSGLLVPLWRGARRDLAPWALAGAVAVAAQRLGLPQPLPLLCGALSGAALAAWLEGRAAR
ncbi:AzlC family ABC transporter permease [Pseudoroseomonas cervicalis]|uniref:AzlC family ABC transporter permease n=1 Tax=Teichococcus cervicalis TaxID=204525 RepID=UPI0022F18E93|nr:AzlC family ABC transporter permease [Pseudoroseomonas cervicalis]WBV42637.1 AzlC family ABC transporter permease [Pseudoroseomonas cervicalis]